MSYEFTERVRVLPESPSEEQIKDYLHWLAYSDFNYHIDDDPEDIIWNVFGGIKNEEVKQLRVNSDRMWGFAPSADFLWDNYPWEVKL